jgi:hypothetical protein
MRFIVAYFLSGSTYKSILSSLVDSFRLHVTQVFRDANALLFTFELILELLLAASDVLLKTSEHVNSLMPSVFLFSYLLPQCYDTEHAVFVSARKMWQQWIVAGSKDQDVVFSEITNELRGLLEDTDIRVL